MADEIAVVVFDLYLERVVVVRAFGHLVLGYVDTTPAALEGRSVVPKVRLSAVCGSACFGDATGPSQLLAVKAAIVGTAFKTFPAEFAVRNFDIAFDHGFLHDERRPGADVLQRDHRTDEAVVVFGELDGEVADAVVGEVLVAAYVAYVPVFVVSSLVPTLDKGPAVTTGFGALAELADF